MHISFDCRGVALFNGRRIVRHSKISNKKQIRAQMTIELIIKKKRSDEFVSFSPRNWISKPFYVQFVDGIELWTENNSMRIRDTELKLET